MNTTESCLKGLFENWYYQLFVWGVRRGMSVTSRVASMAPQVFHLCPGRPVPGWFDSQAIDD